LSEYRSDSVSVPLIVCVVLKERPNSNSQEEERNANNCEMKDLLHTFSAQSQTHTHNITKLCTHTHTLSETSSSLTLRSTYRPEHRGQLVNQALGKTDADAIFLSNPVTLSPLGSVCLYWK